MGYYKNLTENEAAEGLSASRKRYREASEQYDAARREADQYAAEKNAAQREMAGYSSQKLNFEKKLEQVNDLIGVLSGSGGRLSGIIGSDVPSLISDLNGQTSTANESFRTSMRSPDISAADLSKSLGCPGADNDPKISGALEKFRQEKTRLENGIDQLNRNIQRLDDMVDQLSSKLNAANDAAFSSRQEMISSSYDITQYRNALNSSEQSGGYFGNLYFRF